MPTVAFALAGLGGFNAHGAGFLNAATQAGVVPDLVTATSGQIVVLAHWLRRDPDLETLIVDPILQANPAAQLSVALSGEPNVFRPAYGEALMRWWQPPRHGDTFEATLLDRLLPAQIYVPTRPASDFDWMAEVLNDAHVDEKPVAVVFNAYDLATGRGILFGNRTARAVWLGQKHIKDAPTLAGQRFAKGADEQTLHEITPKALQSALWLSLYGFENLPIPHLIDGAYHRSCIVAELHGFDRIFVARPLAEGWVGRPPRNALEVQDWQTEMWFSAGYKAEVDTLAQINGLVRAGQLGPDFKEARLYEVAPKTPAGFQNFFVERRRVFEEARRLGLVRFREAEVEGAAVPD